MKWNPMVIRASDERGVTLLEVLVTLVIILIVASASLPLVKVSSKRMKEAALRESLREMRLAIDRFHEDWAREGDVLTGPLCTKNKATCKEYTGVTGYPISLETLVGLEFSEEDATEKESEKIKTREPGLGNLEKPKKEPTKKSGAFSEPKLKPKKRYLRRIPRDPLTGAPEWGLRCFKDPPEMDRWCKDDVFDVYSLSVEIGLDQTKYRDW